MQIASGWSKGLKILTPEGLDTRPTRGRVRAAALNMLQPWIAGARILDLFAGSGAVGLELVSRGASGCVFLEKDKAALKCLRSNIQGLAERATRETIRLEPWELKPQDVMTALAGFGQTSFDLIWADPPYRLAESFLAVAKDHLPRILAAGGVFAFECGIEQQVAVDAFAKLSGLEQVKQRDYGVTLISIWQKREE